MRMFITILLIIRNSLKHDIDVQQLFNELQNMDY